MGTKGSHASRAGELVPGAAGQYLQDSPAGYTDSPESALWAERQLFSVFEQWCSGQNGLPQWLARTPELSTVQKGPHCGPHFPILRPGIF